MEQALFDTVTVELRAGEAPAGSRGAHAFRASVSTLIEPGFIAAYTQSFDTPSGKEDDDDDKRLPALEAGDRVKLADLIADQHFTEPPPRYPEASLVKTLEEYDIGRPDRKSTRLNSSP